MLVSHNVAQILLISMDVTKNRRVVVWQEEAPKL